VGYVALPRRLETELLDVLPADDPAAVRSRRDLRLLNAVMLHPGILARRMLRHAVDTPRRIIELGAGDGSLMLRLSRRLARHWPGVAIVLVDQKDAVPSETRKAIAKLGWRENQVTQDVFDFLAKAESADIVIANLFLHHFQASQISDVFTRCAKLAPLFIALEPRRAVLPLLGSRLIWLLGCNHVSRHDAVASVRAGFRDRELSALWPDQRAWSLHEGSAGLWTHYFAARKC
jgi:methyltransferase family protein